MLDLNALIATRMMMGIGVLLAGIFMYLFSRKFWGEVGGLVSGLFYMYASYHAVEIYVRGAVGEFWAYAFLPLMALGFYKKNVLIGAAGFAGVVLSHNLTALMLVPFLIIIALLYCYIAYQRKNPLIIYHSSLIILLGLGISAFYWLPALLELGYTNVQSQVGGGADFRDHFVCWQQLWQSQWGFGGSTTGCLDGLSMKIGKLSIVVSFVAFVLALWRWKKDQMRARSIVVAIGLLLFSIFLMLEISKPIWEGISAMAFIQYPWRFLVFASFFSSFLAGALIWFANRSSKVSLGLALALLGVLFYTNVRLFEPKTIGAKAVEDYTSDYHTKWVTSAISDEYMPKDFAKPKSEVEIVERRVSVREVKVNKTQELVFETNEPEEKQVLVAIAPFPAWQVSIDGNIVSYKNTDRGIAFTVPAGKHTIQIAFVSTPTEKVVNGISLVSILILLGGILRNLWRK